MNRTPEWIFFDLDGTLIDSIPALYKAYSDFLDAYGIQATQEEFHRLNGPSLQEIIAILKRDHNLLPDEPSLYEQYQQIIARLYAEWVPMMDGVQDTLNDLHSVGKKMMLVSAAPRHLAQIVIKRFGWGRFFSGYAFGDDVSKAKPYPDIYLYALKQASEVVDVTSVVAVEDSINGIRSSVAAEIPTFGFAHTHTPEQLRNAGATQIFEHFHELLPLLYRFNSSINDPSSNE